MKDMILTFLFTVSINAVIEYLETMPGYNCPPYCEVDHEHYKEMKILESKNKESKND